MVFISPVKAQRKLETNPNSCQDFILSLPATKNPCCDLRIFDIKTGSQYSNQILQPRHDPFCLH